MISTDQHISKLFVIIPAYNETGEIVRVIRSVLSQGIFSVVIIDDGSSNGLKQQLIGLPVYYLRHRANLGQGAALQTGMTFSMKMGAELVVTFDADGQHNASDLPSLIQPILE